MRTLFTYIKPQSSIHFLMHRASKLILPIGKISSAKLLNFNEFSKSSITSIQQNQLLSSLKLSRLTNFSKSFQRQKQDKF
jgi:hypothetical protein